MTELQAEHEIGAHRPEGTTATVMVETIVATVEGLVNGHRRALHWAQSGSTSELKPRGMAD